METGIDVEQAAAAASGITQAVGPFLYLMALLAAAGLGRMIYVAYGDKFQIGDFFHAFSGKGYLVAFVVLCVGMVFYTDREVRAWIVFKSSFVDPVITGVLDRDSCDPQTNRFCVVHWEDDGHERIINWHDKRLSAFEVFGGYQLSLHTSERPKRRPEGLYAQITSLRLAGSAGPWAH